ncbi:DUF934 domain-containing protein [Fulvimarina sp. 2208YS6-2-32]|uniref:DUF934 domain-containing protein n=1 Tax=Fulvimarina uroteuthidis TaxID=3098149 RepID=A0ABU5I0R1_9HYPH|nr:DUF934 domain-containing protein [Fulvimarina sp. 2208YS6-2-32]MDY8108655.1 DUF934 domain-containing protein [Fulvimarina sp. 2208YS6-2-32]
MTIITPAGERKDAYTLIETADEAAPAPARPLVPLTLLGAIETPAAPFGLLVENDADIAEIARHFGAVDLIAVVFPAFADGRGFSLAKRLRREGFEGTLRAKGPLIADQFADALACGFDEVDIPDTMANRQPVQQWLEMKDSMSVHYQTGFGEGQSILQQRIAARRGPDA